MRSTVSKLNPNFDLLSNSQSYSDFSQNNIQKFPRIRKKLKVLKLKYTSLSSIPRDAFPAPAHNRLEELHLEGCFRLVNLPKTIYNLEHLKVLDLHGTGLNKLPEELSLLKRLERLDISKTRICSLPTGIRELKRLKEFRFHHTGILRCIPHKITFYVSRQNEEPRMDTEFSTVAFE